METLKTILTWLSGKKSIIAGLITTTASFLGTQGVLSSNEVAYIAAITLLIFGSASIATGPIVYNK